VLQTDQVLMSLGDFPVQLVHLAVLLGLLSGILLGIPSQPLVTAVFAARHRAKEDRGYQDDKKGSTHDFVLSSVPVDDATALAAPSGALIPGQMRPPRAVQTMTG
jgi:hypothetical protein